MKRTLAILLATAMLCGSLAGCAAKEESSSSSGSGSASSSSSSTGSASSSSSDAGSEDSTYKPVPSGGVPVSDPGVLPIVENKTDMSVFISQSSNVEDYETNKYTLWQEERTNVHILWDAVPSTDAATKLNLLLASGQDLPDLILRSMGTATVVSNGSQGVFIPLNDLIEDYGYWYNQMLEKEPVLAQMMVTHSGTQYSLPRVIVSDANSMSARAYINRTWMDRLGLEMPETTDELRTVLETFRDQDANGNGDPTDEYAWSCATGSWRGLGDEWLMNAFIQYIRTNPYYVEDGVVQASYDKDAYRDGLRYWHGLVEDGLYDPLSFTQDVNQLKQIFEDPDISRVGFITIGGLFGVTDQQGDRAREYEVVPPVAGPDGYRGVWYDPYYDSGYYVECIAITSSCKNPEMVFRWVDSQYTRESSLRNRLGEPGVDWIIPEPGSVAVDGGEAVFISVLPWGVVQNAHWFEWAPCYNDFDMGTMRGDDPYELQHHLWDAVQKYKPYRNDISCYFNSKTFYSEEDGVIVNDIDATLVSYVQQAMSQFANGDLDIEKDWDQYLKNLEGMRYKERLEIMQRYV